MEHANDIITIIGAAYFLGALIIKQAIIYRGQKS